MQRLSVVRDLLEENHPEVAETVGILKPQLLGYYADLTNATHVEQYLHVEKMIQFNIFQKDFLIIPIHLRAW